MTQRLLYLPLFVLILVCLTTFVPHVAAQTRSVHVLDAENEPLTALVDGNSISMKISLLQAVDASTPVDFLLDGLESPIAGCTIAAGEDSCQTDIFPALGWAWNAAGIRQTERVVQAQSAELALGESATLTITPRPVVMVHGLGASWEAWKSYLGPDGYLAAIGVQAYAVGDGQVPGVMNTGSKTTPLVPTNTIAQNAEILSEYIRGVQQATGAEQVDVLAHSMGGIITRYYLDRLMETRNVAQLMTVGSPMGGSSCTILPAALGLMLPAVVELQPNYMQNIFNPQIIRRRGVPFHALAGTKMVNGVQSPCTEAPSDVAVSLTSVKAISMPVEEMPFLHDDLNDLPEVFNDFVLPLLQTPPGDFWQVPDPPLSPPAPVLQFSRVYTGHLEPGETHEVTINIDPGVTVATFALYDTSRSLTTVVTGATGNTIELDPVANGTIRVTDPESMVYLGYGFVEPKAGKWVITLQTTADTPASGSDYAITAQFNGGATLQTTLDQLNPQLNEPVNLEAQLLAAGQSITLTSAEALVRQPDGQVESYPLEVEGNSTTLSLTPNQSGLYRVELNVSAQTEDGLIIDRAAFSVFQAQPTATEITQYRLLVGVLLALGVTTTVGGLLYWRRRRAAVKK